MKRREYDKHATVFLSRPIDEVFEFFCDAQNLERITPPLLNFRITTPLPIEMREGTLIDYAIRIRGVPVKWRTLISTWQPPYRFVDEQLRGPYVQWHHTHTFEEVDGGTLCRDHVRYIVPGGPLAPIVNRFFVRPDVDQIFNYRLRVLLDIFESTEAEPPTPSAV